VSGLTWSDTIAGKADPFTKKRLLALADSYDARIGRASRATRLLTPLPAASSAQS
jgi:hypothetical protein